MGRPEDGELLEGSVPLLLHDVERELRRHSDERIRDALRIATLQLAGYRTAAIREQLGVSDARYREAAAWLKAAVKTTERLIDRDSWARRLRVRSRATF